MLKKISLNQRTIGNFIFPSSYAYLSDESTYVYLISRTGTSIILEKTLFDELQSESIRVELQNKLIQRGFSSSFTYLDVRDRPIRPRFFMIDFTTQCNMSCYYCLRNFNDEGNAISFPQLKAILEYIVSYCRENEIDDIAVQAWGGEPLIAIDKIAFTAEYFEKHDIHARISVQTNGLLLNKNNVDLLSKHKISVGVSMDGVAEIQNIHRRKLGGQDTFNTVTNGLKTLRTIYGDEIGTITVISQFSLLYLEQSLDYFVKHLGLKSIKFNLVHSNGDDFDKSTLVRGEYIQQFVDRLLNHLISLYEEGYEVIEGNIKDRLQNLLTHEFSDLCHTHGCTGGYTFVTFAQNGDVFPCELVGNSVVKMGNINDGISLPELITKSLSNKYFTQRKCSKNQSCDWYSFCRGGCTATILSYNDECRRIAEEECVLNKYLYPKLVELILTRPELIKKMTGDGLNFQ